MADRSRLLDRVSEAFLDGVPIAWSQVLEQSRDGRERALLETMRRLERVREERSLAPAPPAERHAARAALSIVLIAAIQTGAGLMLALDPQIRGIMLSARLPQLLLALAFSLAGGALAASLARDPRRIHLVAAFACSAATFTRSAAHDLWQLSPVAFAGPAMDRLFLEALIPACLWQFARRVPLRGRFTAFDGGAHAAARLTWIVGGALCALNLLVPPAGAPPVVGTLLRGHEATWYWPLFAAMVAPPVAAIWLGARAPGPFERHRVSRLASAMALGAVPFLVSGILWSAQSNAGGDVLAWPLSNGWWDHVVLAALAIAPMLCAAAVIAERPFDLALPVRRTCQTLAARLALRRGWLASHYERRLSDALERLRRCRGARERAAAIDLSLRRTLGLETVRVLLRSANGVFTGVEIGGPELPRGSALGDLVRRAPGAIDVGDDSRLRRLLPSADRRWLVDHAVTMMAAVVLRDDSVAALVALGARRDGRRFGRRDRWIVDAIVAAASAAWDTDPAPPPGDGPSRDEPAFECAACGTVAATPAVSCGCQPAPRLASLPLRLGADFLVERRLAAGAMGVVYEARDVRLDRRVALKTLPRLSAGASARLDEEARAMAALSHAALATLFGVERWRATPVLVVEHLAGGTLADRLAHGAMAADAALAIVHTLASALAYMHGRGMLHRDLKPSNIGFTADGAPKLLDFGLACLARESVETGRRGHRRLAGTPAYLPPEAFDGAAASEAFDRWALAIVLVEAVSGSHPCGGCGEHDPSVDVNAIEERLAAHGAARLAPFCRRALALEPSRRFHTTDEFAAALGGMRISDGRARER